MRASTGDFKQAFGKFKKGLESAVNAASTVAAVVAEEGQGLLGNSKLLRDYRIDAPVATCGPLDIWAIYSGICKKPGAVQKDVSIWILDKKRLQESSKQQSRPKAFDGLFEQQKKGVQNMLRLKHPGVVKVIEPLDDTSQQMILVTEPIFGSLRNMMTKFESVPGVNPESKAAKLSSLDIKQGLMHVTETLTFLHNDAGITHCGLCPHVIMITSDGAWKLAGFTFAVMAATASSAPTYSYSDPFPPMWDELAKPLLPYIAPELVSGFGGTSSIGPPADVFSLATVVYEMLSNGSPLLTVRNNINEYKARVAALPQGGMQDPLSSLPLPIQGVLRSMLAPAAASRPAVGALTSSGFFQDDVLLRALRFIDTILQRDYAQKMSFIKDLSNFWTQFDDDRVLTLRVLPPLIQELRTTEALQPVLLPLVLNMLERVSPQHFMSVLLPQLRPVLENAQGETLGTLLAGSGLLAKLMTQEAVGKLLIPLYGRALDCDSSSHVQDACLKTLQTTLPTLDYGLLKTQIMPRTYSVCMRTTAAGVRASALTLMTQAVSRLDKEEAAHMVDTATQVVGVDRSAATVTHISRLADALSQQHGVEVTAARLLPLLCPLMVAPSLTPRDFQALHATIKGMIDRVAARSSGEGGPAGSHHPQAGNVANVVAWDTPLEPPTHRHKQPSAAGNAAAPSVSWMSTPSTTASKPTANGNPSTTASWTTSLSGSGNNVGSSSIAAPNTASHMSSNTGIGSNWNLPLSSKAATTQPSQSPLAAALFGSDTNTKTVNGQSNSWLSDSSSLGGPRMSSHQSTQLDMFGGLAVHEPAGNSQQSQQHGISGGRVGLGPRSSGPQPFMTAGLGNASMSMASSNTGGINSMGNNGFDFSSLQTGNATKDEFGAFHTASQAQQPSMTHNLGTSGVASDTRKGSGNSFAWPSNGTGMQGNSNQGLGLTQQVSQTSMMGVPMSMGKGMLQSAGSSTLISDPFSSISSMALSAPKPATIHKPAPAVSIIPPPPKPSTTVSHQGTAGNAAPGGLDLLW